MKRSNSSNTWLREHENDAYVLLSRKEGFRSRAVYKLTEIDGKDRLLRPGATVVDLGAAPGSWAQYAAKRIQPGGRLIAVDLLEIAPLPGVEIIQGDFTDDAILAQIDARLAGRIVDQSLG